MLLRGPRIHTCSAEEFRLRNLVSLIKQKQNRYDDIVYRQDGPQYFPFLAERECHYDMLSVSGLAC